MKILAIESTAKAASCAAYIDGVLVAQSYQDAGLTHSKTLMPMVADMLKNAGLTLGDFEYVAAAHGPGSFTGVRIGVATALGLASGAGLKAVGVSTLGAMGAAMAYGGAFEGFLTLCAMDARRGEVYAALFDGAERLTPDVAEPAADFAAKAAEFAKNRGKYIICVGDGAKLCYNQLVEAAAGDHDRAEGAAPVPSSAPPGAALAAGGFVRLAPPHLVRQSAAGVAYAAAELIERGEELPPLRPVYLRLSQAERERLERERASD